MSSDINLLVKKQKGILSEEKLLLFSQIVAVVLIILTVSLSILFLLLTRGENLVAVKADESRTLTQLNLLQDKATKYLLVVDRVNKIKALQQTQQPFETNIATFINQVPTGASITDFTLDQNGFSISISSPDVTLLGKTVDNYMGLVSQDKSLKDVTVESLVSDEKGASYVLTLSGDLL